MQQKPEFKPLMDAEISKKFHLTCTGELYDGVDTELVEAYLTSALNSPTQANAIYFSY